MNSIKVTIVIPVYKSPDKLERISFEQCLKVLKAYPITIACAHSFDPEVFFSIAASFNKEIAIERYEDCYFENIAGYNRLMMSVEFYKRFKKSKYILIYQTDAFVFKDELSAWCDLGFDYIGAPWPFDTSSWVNVYPKLLQKFYKLFTSIAMPNTGNGGLSLRKTSSFIWGLRLFSFMRNRWEHAEDMFFAHCMSAINPFFKMASYEKSMDFSFDVNPEKFFRIKGNKLPFGCHAWFRIDDDYQENYKFYYPIIKSFGYLKE